MFTVKSSGSGSSTLNFLDRLKHGDIYSGLDWAGRRGVFALEDATPVDTGETANSWDYRIVKLRNGRRIDWFNTNVNDSAVIAIMIQYGHGTGDGSWVEGEDYVNPAMVRVFEQIAQDVWRQVTK